MRSILRDEAPTKDETFRGRESALRVETLGWQDGRETDRYRAKNRGHTDRQKSSVWSACGLLQTPDRVGTDDRSRSSDGQHRPNRSAPDARVVPHGGQVVEPALTAKHAKAREDHGRCVDD